MTLHQLNGFNASDFLKEYWQKKPVVLKNAITPFVDPIDENDLAALAQEDSMDSRIISREQGQWSMAQGPFAEFESYCKGQWTLLVQGVEHLIQDTQPLLNLFDFIPNWRIDDLMVSYSVEGAGVGPHIDQYDVFIIQGKGKRRWQVGLPGDYKTLYPHPKLSQIDNFEPIIDEILEPGDIIYIPPGYPHNGVALTECLNYSIGFRAPDQRQLFENIADFMLDTGFVGQRYQDPNIELRDNPAQINITEINTVRGLLKQWIDSPDFEDFFARIASFNQVDPEQQLSPEEQYSNEEIQALLEDDVSLIRVGGVKPTFVQNLPNEEKESFTFFIEKNVFTVPNHITREVNALLRHSVYKAANQEKKCLDPEFIQLITTLVNLGYWYID